MINIIPASQQTAQTWANLRVNNGEKFNQIIEQIIYNSDQFKICIKDSIYNIIYHFIPSYLLSKECTVSMHLGIIYGTSNWIYQSHTNILKNCYTRAIKENLEPYGYSVTEIYHHSLTIKW